MASLVPSTSANVPAPAGAAAGKSVRATDVVNQLVSFRLNNEEFGVPILDVREIILMTAITPVPQSPPFVEGVINLRGQILPVVDLRKRFNLPSRDVTPETRVIVIEVNHNALGLIVDAVSEVLRIPVDTINPPPALLASSIGAEYIKGISHFSGKMIILIDLKRVFSPSEMAALGDV
jgi:purine-binding chemotaxis protein CheW